MKWKKGKLKMNKTKHNVFSQLLYTVVPVYAERADGSLTGGTGFIFSIKVDRKKEWHQ